MVDGEDIAVSQTMSLRFGGRPCVIFFPFFFFNDGFNAAQGDVQRSGCFFFFRTKP